MKKTILKYSSLLALFGSFFFSTQTFGAECATGTVPATGCRIDVSDITYTLTGDITSGPESAGIYFASDNAIVNYTGAISVSTMGVAFDINDNNNTMNMTGNINIAAETAARHGVLFRRGENYRRSSPQSDQNNWTTGAASMSANSWFSPPMPQTKL